MGKLFQYIFKDLDDEKYLKLYWLKKWHKPLNLKSPVTLNEKIQWLKLYWHKPEMTAWVDKFEAKKLAGALIGEEYIIPTLGVWDRWEDIDWDSLPQSFVLKATNGSGNKGIIICKDKSSLDIASKEKRFKKAMLRNAYYKFREWPYKDIEPRIIAEPLLTDDTTNNINGLADYKLMCFGGRPHDIMVALGRQSTGARFYYFDKDWNLLKYDKYSVDLPDDFKLPLPGSKEIVEKMFGLAEKLSQGFPMCRADFYYVGGKIYFGELTFYPCAGFDRQITSEADKLYGDLTILPEKLI